MKEWIRRAMAEGLAWSGGLELQGVYVAPDWTRVGVGRRGRGALVMLARPVQA